MSRDTKEHVPGWQRPLLRLDEMRKMDPVVLFDYLLEQGWKFSITASPGYFEFGGMTIEGEIGNKACCDEKNTCRRCKVPIQWDLRSGHGYSHFSNDSLNWSECWSFGELMRFASFAISEIKPGQPR